MKNALILLSLILLLGCKSATNPEDTFLLNAERSRDIAVQVIDTYLKVEHTNRLKLWAASPKYKQVADFLRKQTPPVVEELNTHLVIYRAGRSNAESVTGYLNQLNTFANQAVVIKADAQSTLKK